MRLSLVQLPTKVNFSLGDFKVSLAGVISLKNNVKKLRDESGYTQDQLAELVEVSRQTIISIEKEKYDPSLELAFKFSSVFNQSIEDIFIYDKNNWVKNDK